MQSESVMMEIVDFLETTAAVALEVEQPKQPDTASCTTVHSSIPTQLHMATSDSVTSTKPEEEKSHRVQLSIVYSPSTGMCKFESAAGTFTLAGNNLTLFLATNVNVQLFDQVTKLQQLTKLEINGLKSKLTELPDCISRLTHLRELHATQNRLSALPCTLGALAHLEVLNVRENCIQALPWSLRMCKNLIQLDLSNNSFNCFPYFLLTMPQLSKFRRLNNNTDQWYNRIMLADQVTEVHSRVEKQPSEDKRFQPVSLKKASLFSFLKTGLYFSHPELLPCLLRKEALICCDKAIFCDACSVALCSKYVSYSILVFPKFLNATYVPVKVYYCSRTCFDQIVDSLTGAFESISPFPSTLSIATLDFNVIPPRHPHRRQRTCFLSCFK